MSCRARTAYDAWPSLDRDSGADSLPLESIDRAKHALANLFRTRSMPLRPHSRAAPRRRTVLGGVASLVALAVLPLGALDAQRPASQTLQVPVEYQKLSNGLKVVMSPDPTTPTAVVAVYYNIGFRNEPKDRTGFAHLFEHMMFQGSQNLGKMEFIKLVESNGGTLNGSTRFDFTNYFQIIPSHKLETILWAEATIGGSVLSERAADFVRLIADVTQNPRFPESELPRIKAARVRQVVIAKSQPQPLAQERFYQVLYGDHALGRLYPTEQMLNGYTVDQIRAFHAKNFGAARAHLYVAGVYDAAAVEKAIRESFGSWAKGPDPVTNVPKPKSGRRVELIDRPNAVQSTLVIGLPVPGASHADYTALSVTDALIGGAFGSRITTNIREQKGYTYSPYSTITTHYGDAFWGEFADVTTNVTGPSLKEIFGEIDRLRKEPPPATELRGIQNNMAGIFTLQNASRGGVVGQLQFVDLHGLPDSFLTEYVKRVMAVSPADVQRVMRTYLRPENMTIVVVGDKKVIEEQVKPYSTYVP